MRRYDQSAKAYDTLYQEEQEAKIRTAMDNLTLNKGSIVLDAGCGTGSLFKHVARKTKFVVGTDISRGILKEAMKKARQHKKVALVLADVDNMPFSDSVFEIVFAITLLQNTPNPRATLYEIERLSQANATIVVTGLRKAFTEEGFSMMLKQANLNVAKVQIDRHMREYVAVCMRMCR